MKTNRTFICRHCGGEVRQGSSACPHCGSDDRTGWSDATYLDGVDLADDVDYDEMVAREFGGKPRGRRRLPWVYVVVGAVVLLMFVLGILRGLLG